MGAEQKGTGLGLSIVKTIIEAHHGSIECKSELKKGTAFILHLPRN
jgi:signal transduction histidine kinase